MTNLNQCVFNSHYLCRMDRPLEFISIENMICCYEPMGIAHITGMEYPHKTLSHCSCFDSTPQWSHVFLYPYMWQHSCWWFHSVTHSYMAGMHWYINIGQLMIVIKPITTGDSLTKGLAYLVGIWALTWYQWDSFIHKTGVFFSFFNWVIMCWLCKAFLCKPTQSAVGVFEVLSN